MRLWSLHPQYLDSRGLVAVWREGLLAQAVLADETRGYRNHPQLARFRQTPTPERYIAAYLRGIHTEASRRGFRFDKRKIRHAGPVEPLAVTSGQIDYEWAHLKAKLQVRNPSWVARLEGIPTPELHPLFRAVPGEIADWESVAQRAAVVRDSSN
jgi:hypothetical protein